MFKSSQPTVLIVEDEVFTRIVATDVFEEAGFNVIEASNSSDALKLLADRPDIAVLFTDVDMPPGINGYRLAQGARLTHPDLVVMVTSGRQALREADLPARGRFAMKPYDVTKMLANVREMMAAL